MQEYFAAVDIGATKTTVSVFSRDGILSRVYQPTRKRGDRGTVPRQVDFLIGLACRRAAIGKARTGAVGVSTASPFEKRAGWQAGKPWKQAPEITVLESDVE